MIKTISRKTRSKKFPRHEKLRQGKSDLHFCPTAARGGELLRSLGGVGEFLRFVRGNFGVTAVGLIHRWVKSGSKTGLLDLFLGLANMDFLGLS